MSRRLGALTIALGILLCSMGLKTALTTDHSGKTVIQANGPAPVPGPPGKKGPSNGPAPVPGPPGKSGPSIGS